MARINLDLNNISNAESLAMKALVSTKPDNETKRSLWLLISLAREKSGNSSGGIEARNKAFEIPY